MTPCNPVKFTHGLEDGAESNTSVHFNWTANVASWLHSRYLDKLKTRVGPWSLSSWNIL